MTELMAHAHIVVDASPEQVWEGLTSPELTRLWMGGAEVASDWVPGSTITWSGLVAGQPFEDSGTVLEVDPPTRLRTTHRSGGLALADAPVDPHVVTYDVVAEHGGTLVSVTQEGPDQTPDSVAEYEQTWALMLQRLKDVVQERVEASS